MDQEPEIRRCSFFVTKKKRTCRMMVKAGQTLCGEHSVPLDRSDDHQTDAGGRVQCPYDTKHTCDLNNLQKHLKRCPSRPQALPVYSQPGVNSGSESSQHSPEVLSMRDVPDQVLMQLIQRVDQVYESEIGPFIKECISSHPILESEICQNPHFGPDTLKHLKQNSSLLGLLQSGHFLQSRNVFVEFGSGRGQLTYWLVKALWPHQQCRFVLIDKDSHRHKFDNKLKDQAPSAHVTRLRVDIQDLLLHRLPDLSSSTSEHDKVVAVSKHLCGAATDFALKCLHNYCLASGNKARLDGILIALCCHHRCQWSSFVGKSFLTQKGFTAQEFSLLCGLTSWATCGTGKSRAASLPKSHSEQNEAICAEKFGRLQLEQARREEVGRRSKRILDWARLSFLLNATDLKRGTLVSYVQSEVSPENVALFVHREEIDWHYSSTA